uniref:Putative Pkinase-domain-containing protein n=1 Tax=Moniliophthora roreri TaxID=221103 RepID=A0A0W0F0Z9_MONRR
MIITGILVIIILIPLSLPILFTWAFSRIRSRPTVHVKPRLIFDVCLNIAILGGPTSFMVFFIYSTEQTVRLNRAALKGPEEESWSYGQTLALVTALISICMPLLGKIIVMFRAYQDIKKGITQAQKLRRLLLHHMTAPPALNFDAVHLLPLPWCSRNIRHKPI